MKKYLIVTNTITNGGDHLLTQCGLKLAYRFLPKENCRYINNYCDDYNLLNLEHFDAMIYIGGPGYADRLLSPQNFPLLYHMKNLKRKFSF